MYFYVDFGIGAISGIIKCIMQFWTKRIIYFVFSASRNAIIPPLKLNTFLNPAFNKMAAAVWAWPPLRHTVIISASLCFSSSFSL